MKTIKIDATEYQLKSSFAEFTPKELKKVAYLRSLNMDHEQMDQIDFNAVRIALFTALSNVPMHKIQQIYDDQWVDILPHLNFVFKSPDFKTNPLPQLKFRFRKFYGPLGLLDKVTMGEMTNADTVFTAAANTKSTDKMYLLAAILYRPVRSDLADFKASKKWNGDIREPFNLTKCQERIPIFKKMPFYVIVIIFLYYWAFRDQRLMKFKRLFSKSEGSESGSGRGWAGTILEMAHLPLFGNVDDVAEQDWFTVLYEMDRQLEAQQKREDKAKQEEMLRSLKSRK